MRNTRHGTSTDATYIEHVENRLGESHDHRHEPVDGRDSQRLRRRLDVNEVDVEEIDDALADVHERLSGRESVFAVPRGQAVDVVDIHVERVGRPEPMQVTAEHASRTQQDVADIPGNDKGAEEEPGGHERARAVHYRCGCCCHLRCLMGEMQQAVDDEDGMVVAKEEMRCAEFRRLVTETP